jgi:hypothetical protein
MDPKVAKEDLEDIVEEAARLDRDEKEAISRGEAREVLRELDIAPEKLEEAERAVKERRAREAARAKTRTIAAVTALAIAAAATIVMLHLRSTAAAIARTTPLEHAVTAEGRPSPFDRAASPALTLDVTLKDAPKGDKLDLSCDWKDPSGVVVHQNKYTTKTIDKDPWPTHCRYTLAPSSKTGTWNVTMKQGDRVLSSDAFEVR